MFATPTTSFKIFCPSPHAKLNDSRNSSNDIIPKRPHNEKNYDRKQDTDPNKRTKIETKGLIINKTGKKNYFPKGMEKKHCSDFLDAGESYGDGDKCNFIHTVFPGGFINKDKLVMEKNLKMKWVFP